MSSETSTVKIWLPLALMAALAAGILIGSTFFESRQTRRSERKPLPPAASGQRLNEILYYIDEFYVDSVDADSLTEHTIGLLLEQLDPHTAYIPAEDLEVVSANLEGNFEGVGIEFNLVRDTIYVIAPIANGPSEAAGIQAGDKIVEVEGEVVAGVGITNREVIDKLRGEKGTQVTVGVKRKGEKELLPFTITRDEIPTYTVNAAFKVDEQTGYIKLSRFGANSYEEFRQALQQLIGEGMSQLVLDLRGNPGGYMGRAVSIVDELLGGKALIVYTDGKVDSFDAKEYAGKDGLFESGGLVVLIDEGSASASEIVAGALQDNDRALVVGRRSFGKGLVQKPIGLSDNSQLRLTISRYYTPSGRSIQKPYQSGAADYANEIWERYQNGEFFALDSSKLDQEHIYKTVNGRTVLGGGGIVPDHFVPRDTSYYSPLLDALLRENLLREFASEFVRINGSQWEKRSFEDFQSSFTITSEMEEALWQLAAARGIEKNPTDYARSEAYIKTLLRAIIARLIWQDAGYYPIILEQDATFQAALRQLQAARKLSEDHH